MTRILKLMAGDIRFQLKYGFYLLYGFFTLLYIIILYILPSAWKQDAALLIIFSDPALLGMIFTGVIVLFEKSERVINSIAISPVKPSEYILSKAITLGVISSFAGILPGIVSGSIEFPARFISGLFFGSCIFTWTGILTSTKINTLNQYMMYLIPLLIVVVCPVIVYQFINSHAIWLLHPGVAAFELLNPSPDRDLASGISIGIWLIISYALAKNQFSKMLKSLGGAKI